jgi:hypothetical protein
VNKAKGAAKSRFDHVANHAASANTRRRTNRNTNHVRRDPSLMVTFRIWAFVQIFSMSS